MSAAGAGLVLHLLNLGLLGWLWGQGRMDVTPMAGAALLPTALRVLAWGVGFSTLALIMVWRVGHRYEVLMAALFLAFYSLWGGLREAFPLRDEMWWPAAMILLDALTHAVGVRFTQLFPRPLERRDLLSLGPGWLRRSVMPVLAALLDRRVFWAAAVVIEGGTRLLPEGFGASGVHVLLWVALAATYLFASYRRGDARDRQRIFWIMEGVLVFVVAQIVYLGLWAVDRTGALSLDLQFWAVWLWAITAWLTLTCFYLAVFHSGAFDSGFVVRRTTVLSASSLLAVLIFITLEAASEEILNDVLGVESRAGAILGGVVAGLTFHPLSLWIDRRVRRSFADGATHAGRAETVEDS